MKAATVTCIDADEVAFDARIEEKLDARVALGWALVSVTPTGDGRVVLTWVR